MKKIIIVSNRLPVSVGKTIRKSSGGLVSALEALKDNFHISWIGWTGGVLSEEHQKKEIYKTLKHKYDYIPVFLSAQDQQDYYDGFSNSSLWPLLHYMPTHSRQEKSWFEAYQNVNQQFAETILQVVNKEDLIWIHDYHLMLLPSLLREKGVTAPIGFFLHTPFPSYEIFRCHPERAPLLEGLLGADLIGFHTYNYLMYFQSSLLRVLGLESDVDSVSRENHRTALGVYPIGINGAKFRHELHSALFPKHCQKLQSYFSGKKIVLSVERLDYTKGILRRLDAIDLFLQDFAHPNQIVFVFISIPSRENVQAYKDLRDEVQRKISQINGKYATLDNIPLHFIHKSISFGELCALYAMADVALVTPLIDGMNLVAKEYIACQQNKKGVLILSEFAGAAHELFNAIIVNPYDIYQVAGSIHKAIHLSEEEKARMLEPMQQRIWKTDARFWAQSFLEDLETNFQRSGILPGISKIPLEDIAQSLCQKPIAFFLDYDGTLCELKQKPSDASPNEELQSLFSLLEKQPQLDIFLISGRKKEDMDAWFSSLPFCLIAEHGTFYREPGHELWNPLGPPLDVSWKEQIRTILAHYTDMTPGSSIEEKTASLVWHYRRSDPDFGLWKANQLVGELSDLLSNIPVVVRHGKKIVEVTSSHINKGAALEHFWQVKYYANALCAGDDQTDESMFRLTYPNLISIKIGTGHTHAKYRISSPAEFRAFLARLLQRLEKEARHASKS